MGSVRHIFAKLSNYPIYGIVGNGFVRRKKKRIKIELKNSVDKFPVHLLELEI